MDLSNPTTRSKLKPRSAMYRQQLGGGVELMLYVGARGSTWRGRIPGAKDFTIGPEAEVSYADALARLQARAAADDTSPDTMTIGTAWADYVARADRTKTAKAARQIRSYGTLIGALADEVIATVPLTRLNRWRDELVTVDRSATTVNKYVRSLKAALNATGINGPWQDLRQLDERTLDGAEDVERTVLDPAQLRQLVKACYAEDEALGAFSEALALTGARPGELRALKAGRYRNGTLTLRTTKGKRPADRHIPLPPAAAAWFARQAEGKPAGAPLFTKADGTPWEDGELRRPIERALARPEAAGLPDGVSPYTFRHSFITAAIYANVPVFVLAKQAGTSVAMIERTYGHVIAEMQRGALAELDRMLGLGDAPVLEAAE